MGILITGDGVVYTFDGLVHTDTPENCVCCLDCEAARLADPFNIGGCCFADGSCVPLHECDCAKAGGFFKGRFVTCAMLPPCAQPPGGEPGPGGGEPPGPRVCVHFYEGIIQCVPDGSGGFIEEIGPVNRTRSSCEACDATPQYLDVGPGGEPQGPTNNNGWVRETRADGSDYWVLKWCDPESTCGTDGDCTGGGPDPSEFGPILGLPIPTMVSPGEISDYCANQTYTGEGDPPPYIPSIPGYEGSEGMMVMSPASMMLFFGASSTGGGGCGACKDEAEGGLSL